MRNLLSPLLAIFLLLASPSIAQTWEIYDLSGSLKSRAVYDDINLLGEAVTVGKNTDGLFLLSPELNPIVNLQGEEIFQYLKPWILVKGPKGIGAFHEYGQLALPPEYEEISTYTNRLLARKGAEYWIFEKTTGKTFWIGKAEEAKLTHNGIVIVKNEGSYYLPLSATPEKPYQLLQENSGDFLLAKEASGFGLIDQGGNYVLDPVIDQLEYTSGDNFYGFDENQYLLIRGFEPTAQVRYNSYHKITKEGDLMLEYIHGKLRRVIEEEGILLDAVGMEEVKLIGKDAFNVRFRENKLGLLGKKGWLVAPNADAEWIGEGNEGFFPARKSGKFGYLNSSGKWIIPPTFIEVGRFAEKVSTYRSGSTWGVLSSEGKVLGEARWEEIKPFSGGHAIATLAGKQYLLRSTGELALEEGFDKISRLKEGYFLVENGTKSGLLSAACLPLIPIAFDYIQVENKDFLIVAKEGLSGVLKANGDTFLPLQYSKIQVDWVEQKIMAKGIDRPTVLPEAIPAAKIGKKKKGA
jgi:hypothetical protein